jgi:uncharacterized membrane protein YoaK (UPF0700 family)
MGGSHQTPSDPRTLYLSFTGLLYAVVIDAALHRLHDLSLSHENILLVVALLIVIQDYFFYYRDILELEHLKKKASYIFWLDILVLGAWYALSLAAHLSTLGFTLYLCIFFLAVNIWDATVNHIEKLKRRPLLLTHVPITVLCLLFFALSATLDWPDRDDNHVLAFLLILFLVWRIYYWVKTAPQPTAEQTIEDARGR